VVAGGPHAGDAHFILVADEQNWKGITGFVHTDAAGTAAMARAYERGPYRRKCGHVHPVGVYPEQCRPTLNHKRKPATSSRTKG
jgi:hypothetical protein